MTPAQDHRRSVSRAARIRRIASNILRTAWLTSLAGLACTTLARRDRRLISWTARRRGYCKRHAEDGMVDVGHNSCSYASSNTRPIFNATGSKMAVYCKQHAMEGIVNVRRKRCSHDSCTKQPTVNTEGSKTAAYYKQNTDNDMVNVHRKVARETAAAGDRRSISKAARRRCTAGSMRRMTW